MRIDSYPVTSTVAGVAVNKPAAGKSWKYARVVKLKNTSGTATLGCKDRGTYPLAAGIEVNLDEVNRAGQSGKFSLDDLVLRGVGVTEVILIDPSDE